MIGLRKLLLIAPVIMGAISATTLLGAQTNDRNMNDLIKEATNYVIELPDEADYDDAYKLVTGEKGSSMVSAIILEYWPIARQQFLSEERLTDEQKKLKHYKVSFQNYGETVDVLFRPLFLPRLENNKVIGRLRATLGQEVKISIASKTRKVQKVIYAKQ